MGDTAPKPGIVIVNAEQSVNTPYSGTPHGSSKRSATIAHYGGVERYSGSIRRHRAYSEHSNATYDTYASTVVQQGEQEWSIQSYTVLILLALVWGSAFLAIKWTVAEIPPFTLVALRLLGGGVLMTSFSAILMCSKPAHLISFQKRVTANVIMKIIALGLFNYSLPFTLVAYAMKVLPVGTVAIFDSAIPLFAYLVGLGVYANTRHALAVTRWRVVGLILGVISMILLAIQSLDIENLSNKFSWDHVTSSLLCILAAFSMALSSILGRRFLRKIVPIQATAGSILSGGVFSTVLALFVDPRRDGSWTLEYLSKVTWVAWVCLVYLAVLSSCLAYALYISLLETVGQRREAVLNYLLPFIAIIEGAFIFGDAWHENWWFFTIQCVAMALMSLGSFFIQHLKAPEPENTKPLLRRSRSNKLLPNSRSHTYSQTII